MSDFYVDVITRLMRRGWMHPQDRVLVTCGGPIDRAALLSAGIKEAVISNVDERVAPAAFSPFEWSYQDAEHLTYEDRSFDIVVCHSGLHHCRSPHRALLEMYRVARKGLLVFEPRDGWLVRLGTKLGFGQEYEVAAVVANESTWGGVANSAIPNYVYRWSRREVEKTISSYAPEVTHEIAFFNALRIPEGALALQKKKLRLAMAKGMLLIAKAVQYFPPLANNIAFFVRKPAPTEHLQPWLRNGAAGVGLNRDWISSRFK